MEESPKCFESPRANSERGLGADDSPPASSTIIRELKKSAEKSELKRYVPTDSSTSVSPFSLDQASIHEGLFG